MVQHLANRDLLADPRDACESIGSRVRHRGVVAHVAHVVAVAVGEQRVVDSRGRPMGGHAADIAGEPLARGPGIVGACRGQARPAPGQLARVDQHRRSVGKNEERTVSPAGADLVNVEGAGGPGRQDLADNLRAGRPRQGQDREHRDGDFLHCVSSGILRPNRNQVATASLTAWKKAARWAARSFPVARGQTPWVTMTSFSSGSMKMAWPKIPRAR